MQKGDGMKSKQNPSEFLWIEVMVRVWSLLYAQLHKNYLERYFISIRHAHTRSTHTFRLLHSCVLSPYSFTLSECERTTKKLALENFMFCPESVNYVNVLICNYVYVSKRLLYYYSIVSTRRHVYFLFRSFFAGC